MEHRGVTCRGCGAGPVRGIRHKCVECLDYDLCEDCLSSPKIRSEHNLGHHLFPIELPWDHTAFRSVSSKLLRPESDLRHEGVRCGGCYADVIIGVRHQCLVCDSFNLCVSCFGDPTQRASHHINHAFFPLTQVDQSDYEAARERLRSSSSVESAASSETPPVTSSAHDPTPGAQTEYSRFDV